MSVVLVKGPFSVLLSMYSPDYVMMMMSFIVLSETKTMNQLLEQASCARPAAGEGRLQT
jgi:hypothetical protein